MINRSRHRHLRYDLLMSLEDEPPPLIPTSLTGSSSPESSTDATSPAPCASPHKIPSSPVVFSCSELSTSVVDSSTDSPRTASPRTASSPAVSSPTASSYADHADEEKEEWEDDDDTDPWAAVNLIRASLEITQRPSLPPPPERHPSANWWNHFNSEMEVDTEADRPVDKWKARDPSISFKRYYGKSFGCAGDSKSGQCFLHAFPAACFGLGNNFPGEVVSEDIDKFFNFVRS
ncbi:hypothetical protein PHMEG_00026326 [Phytophthora megakarya]|uniref:Uncharacterized protein n=1 Tax=Phytophthora megakarya TaxID=4795 RepID=A0A225V8R5_9STRA|nr:hypothetical protein PHMEG_00026326 [Phytophthora megakarya]